MPIRGENVGSAYVKILADGTGLSDSIRDELDDTDGVFADKGKAHGEEYDEALAKQLKKDRPKTQKAVTEAFEGNTARIRQITEELGSTFFKNIEKNVKKQYGNTLGERMLNDIRDGFIRGNGYTAFGKDMEGLFERLPDYAARASAAIAADEARQQKESIGNLKERENAVRLSAQRQADYWRNTINEAYSMNARLDAQRARSTTEQQRSVEILAKAEIAAYRERDSRLEDSVSKMEGVYKRLQRGERNFGISLSDSIKGSIKDLRDLRVEVERFGRAGGDSALYVRTLDDMERGLIGINPRFRRFNGALDDVAPKLGVAFGKGSRNDFVNFFGSAIEGTTKLVAVVPKGIEKLVGLSSQFTATLKAGQGFGAALRGLAGGGAGGLGGLAKAGPAAAAGLAILVLVLPVIASTIALLGGAITALAGSITFALIGAVGALAGALLPVVAGISVLTAGILSMSDAQKKALSTAIKPLTSEFKELGRIAADEIFRDAATQATALGTAIKKSNAGALVRNISTAIRDVGSSWIRAIDTPGFRNFVDVLSVTLPGQVRDLGDIFQNTVGGIGGLFIGLQPLTARFLGYLDDLTARFSKFTNSADGQSKIVSFFERAGDSAASLGGLLSNVTEALGKVFTAGQETGDTIIDQMADKVQEFIDYLDDNPDAVGKFFQQAGEFASQFGRAVEGVIKVFNSLDSEASRSTATEIFERLGDALQFIGTLGGVIEDGFYLIKGALEIIFLPATTLISLFSDGIPGAIATVLNTFADFVDGLSIVGKAIDLLPGVDSVSDSIDGLADSMRGLADDVKGVKDETSEPVDVKTGPGFQNTISFADKMRFAMLNALAQSGKTLNVQVGSGFGLIIGKAASAQKSVRDLLNQSGGVVNVSAGAGFGGLIGLAVSASNAMDRLLAKGRAARSLGASSGAGATASGGIFGGIAPRMANAATGAMANFAQTRLIGESGREAVVPLQRPLGQVDPAVRMLSAFAQGKLGSTSSTTNSRTVDASGWTILSNSEDPRRVADEVLNDLAGAVF